MRRHFPLSPATGLEDQSLLPWFDGDPVAGLEGSFPGHALSTDAEAEILTAIRLAGLTPSDDLTQLVQGLARGPIWLGTLGGTADALAATMPGSDAATDPVFLPALLPGTRVRGVAKSANATATPTLTLTGVGSTAGGVTFPIVASDGASAVGVGAWKMGQFLTFDIDASAKARLAGGAVAASFPGASFVPLPGIAIPSDVPYVDWSIPSGYDFFRLTGFLKGQVPNVNALVSLDGSTFLSGTNNYNAGYGSTYTASTPFNTNPLYAASGLNFGQICDLSLGFATVLSNLYRGSPTSPVTMFGSSQGYQNGIGYSASSFMSNVLQSGMAQKLRFYANGSNQFIRGGSYIGIEGFKYA
ncbi:hypothetical protein [Methylobacterium sp. 391_Methyba4]|uniref:hypothetical protein n=1 Tax=Methylobacterium sp. 391_Methyba4 TaxID=3038924 RepID=UPI00241E8AF1|nr:hypothetical protein [Methylobacterium sp. 391_Methyba4]WFS07791.1 hypothetical protein P9K36_00340 [Methylobacterium sp. 391_Methyba4]